MKQGFTLIELLVVVLIVGILTAIALPQYETAMEKTRVSEALVVMKAIVDSSQRFHQAKPNWNCVYKQEQIADIDLKGGSWVERGGTESCKSPETGDTVVGSSFRTRNFRYDLGGDNFRVVAYRLDTDDGEDVGNAHYILTYDIDGNRTCDKGENGDDIDESICHFVTQMNK